MCDLCNDALKNEQKWIDIALEASKLLEQAGLALPAGDLREKCLTTHAAIQTTPYYNAKKKSSGRVSYEALKAGHTHELEYPLFD